MHAAHAARVPGATWTQPSLLSSVAVFMVSNMFGGMLLTAVLLCRLLPLPTLLLLASLYYSHCLLWRSHVRGWRPGWLARQCGVWMRYFDPVLVLEEGLQPGARYVFCCGPHGIHCFGTGLLLDPASAFYAPGAAPFLRGKLVGLVATVLFYLPLVREAFLGVGCRDASRATAARALREGNSVFLIVGGEAEALLSCPGRDDCVVAGRRRRGFARLALSQGAELVPVYVFRNTDTFATSAAFARLRRWLSKAAQICVPLWSGRWLTPLPFNVRLVVAVGKPVPFPASQGRQARAQRRGAAAGPAGAEAAAAAGAVAAAEAAAGGPAVSEEAIEEYHAAYIEALRTLFERHKGKAGYPSERKLVIHSSDS